MSKVVKRTLQKANYNVTKITQQNKQLSQKSQTIPDRYIIKPTHTRPAQKRIIIMIEHIATTHFHQHLLQFLTHLHIHRLVSGHVTINQKRLPVIAVLPPVRDHKAQTLIDITIANIKVHDPGRCVEAIL